MDKRESDPSIDQGPTVSSQGAEPTGTLRGRVSAFLETARKDAINAIAIVAMCFVVWAIVQEMTTGDYEVMTVEVPATLAQRISGEVVSASIRDGIAEDWRRAANSSPINVIQRDKEEPEVVIGGTNLPLRYVARVLRRVFGHPVIEITGHVTEVASRSTSATTPKPERGEATPGVSGDKRSSPLLIRMTLRDGEGSHVPFFNEEGELDDVVQDAALASLERIDPFAAVLAGSQGTHDQRLQALRVAKTTLAETTSARGGAGLQVGKALLAEATALFGLERNAQSEDYLQRAIGALGRPSPDHDLLAVAQDGLAIIYIQRADWMRAREAVRAALRERSDYDSAEYHRIEIDDKISRAYFGIGPDNPKDPCLAEISYQAAVLGYNSFIAKHPRFAIAYTQYATMRFIRINWLRRGYRLPDCGYLPHVNLSVEQADTRDAFEQATNEDSRNDQSWFQNANLNYELQDPQYFNSETDISKRRFLIADAEASYRRALDLNTSDYYVWFRFAETLVQDWQLRSMKDQAVAKQATAAYCRSIAMNRRDPGLSEAARAGVARLQGTCAD